ncbi:MAG: 50S ribosomal protein L16 [Candidatus Nanoarchaeia archaeon]|nr:50S ribosomal protein L16 [Candidatus Nanoarchaeia archaeon]
MAGLRKGNCYSRKVERPYTRFSKYKARNFVKGVPPSKVARFESGNPFMKYTHRVDLVAVNSVQVRHNSLESGRQVVTRRLELGLNKAFLIKLRAHPHHILRENKILSGAHSDRIGTGMAHSFGKPTGTAAQVHNGKIMFSVYVNVEGIEKAKEALKMAPARMPGRYTIEVHEHKK